MSTLLNTRYSRTSKFRQDFEINKIPLRKPSPDTITAVFTRFFTVAGVPWRYAIRKIEGAPNVLEFELHCHCDARSFFMLEMKALVKIIHPENDQLSIQQEHVLPMDWKKKTFKMERFAEISHILNPENGYLIGEDQKIRVEFDTSLLGVTSAALPIPNFSAEVEYHDVCIQTPQKDFYVSSMILKERLRSHKRILSRRTGNLIDLRRHVRTWEFFEFLKLVYLYQDDINITNVVSSLKLAKRYGAEGVTFMLEKYLLRTNQLHVIDKLVLADKYGLDHVLNMAIRSINTEEQFDEYKRLSPIFQALPLAIRNEIQDQLHDSRYKMYEDPELKIEISDTDFPVNGVYKTDKEEFRSMEMWATMEADVLNGIPGFKMKVFCQGPLREEYYLARMKLVFKYDGQVAEGPAHMDALFTPHHSSVEMRINRYPFDLTIKVALTELHVTTNFTRNKNVNFHDANRLSNAALILNGVTYHVIKEVLASSSSVFETLFKGSYRKRKRSYQMSPQEFDNFEEGLQHFYQGGRTMTPRGYYDLLDFIEKIGSARLFEELDVWSCRRWPELNETSYKFAKDFAFHSMLLTLTYQMYGTAGVLQVAEAQLGPEDGIPPVVVREVDEPLRRVMAAARETPPQDPVAPEAPEEDDAEEEEAPEAPRNIFAENIALMPPDLANGQRAPEELEFLAELQRRLQQFPEAQEAQRQADDHVNLAIREIRNIREPPQPPMNVLQHALVGMGGGHIQNAILAGVRRAMDQPNPEWPGILAPNDMLQMQQLLEGLQAPPQFPAQNGPFPAGPGPFPAGPMAGLPLQVGQQGQGPNPDPNPGPDGFRVPQDPDGI